MIIRLPQDIETALRAEVISGHFVSMDAAVAEAVRAFLRLQSPAAENSLPRKPIWEEIQEITAGIPDEEWRKLPVDGAEQHDHYIYGTPKRPKA